MNQIAALLPKLIADSVDRDRWSLSELLERLGWPDPFGLRYTHSFPIDSLYESNAPTEEALARTLSAAVSGYISLIGPPGSGKSTLLATGLLPTERAYIVRYLAFVPGQAQGLGRGESFDFLRDLVVQLKQQGLGKNIISGTELYELRQQFESLLREAGERFRKDGIRTIFVLDGLDHVPREERPQHSLLCELPAPQAVPDGVIFILGTQRLDLDDIPASVSDQASEDGRRVQVEPLTRDAVTRIAELARVPADVDRGRLYSRTEGHPLSTRYVISGLLNSETVRDREEWLANGPSFGGDVDAFYKRAWHDVEEDQEGRRGMAYLALAEGAISPSSLDGMIGSRATDAVWRTARHLLSQDKAGAWSIFHNSFRLFLREKTSLRHKRPDDQGVRRRYLELAEMARTVEGNDPQRWMELRYRARAGAYDGVAELAKPERFRMQFIDGRNPAEIGADLSFGFYAAKALHMSELVLDLILATHELGMRTEAIGDEVFSAFLELGNLAAARGLIETEALSSGRGFELVTAYLATGETAEARKLFEALEPVDELLGSEPVQMHQRDERLERWAGLALTFRKAGQILGSLSRLRIADSLTSSGRELEDYRTGLKLIAARGQLFRNPEIEIELLMRELEIGDAHLGFITFFAASSAYAIGDYELALKRLEACLPNADELPFNLRRECSRIASDLARAELSVAFLEGVPTPTLKGPPYFGDEDLREASREIVLHASLISRANLPFSPGERPGSPLLANYQARLEVIGTLLGDGLAGRQPYLAPLEEFETTLDFLERGEGKDRYDTERWTLDRAMDAALIALVETACSLGDETLRQLTEMIDARLSRNAGRLGRPSIRRAYATAVFRCDHDSTRAEGRLLYAPDAEQTPADVFREASLTASTLALFGRKDRANELLASMHNDGLGYSRPARKDPQYRLWRDLFVRANKEDPSGRPGRLRFFGRLLNGMAETEGSNAAGRVTRALLQEAAQADFSWAASAADLVDKCGFLSWPDIVAGLTIGVVRAKPQLAEVAAIVYGRTAVPFDDELRFDGGAVIDVFRELVHAAPPDQLQPVIRKAIDCLEADAHPDSKILALEAVVEAAQQRGVDYGREALSRWRGELPLPRSGSSPEDPFFLVRTLGDIAAVLSETRDSVSSHGAVSAFVTIAPKGSYQEARTLFDLEPRLNEDEHSIEVMARLSIVNGEREHAEQLASRLRALAEEHGSWAGGYRSQAKQRYYQLRVALGDGNAHRAAFDAFVDDLANRRESSDYLLMELESLLELTSPALSWTRAWERLEVHLSEFREYKRAREFEGKDTPGSPEGILADILLRAVETTASPLTEMSRTAAIEIAGRPGSVAVIAALLPRLLELGGYHMLEASQIVWECRAWDELRPVITPLLSDLNAADDLAVRRIAISISRDWGLPVRANRGELSAIYTIALPVGPESEMFEPPSGMSATHPGLYAEDVSTWTWPLKRPLRMTSEITGVKLANLRFRVFQQMSRIGGTDAFGPSAVDRQLTKLRRLELRTPFRRLPNVAAFQAMREVLAELDAADAVPAIAASHILVKSGAFSRIVHTRAPIARPVGISAPILPEALASREDSDWLAGVEDDTTRPHIKGFTILAATALHERGGFQGKGGTSNSISVRNLVRTRIPCMTNWRSCQGSSWQIALRFFPPTLAPAP